LIFAPVYAFQRIPAMASAAAMPSVSIGNYKGVMLCNRPFASVAGNGQSGAPAAKGAFVCGAVGDQLGVGAAPHSREAPPVERPRKETALLKHRQWLRALQKTKEDLERTYKDEAEAKEDRHRKFTEREAKMRQMVRETKTKAVSPLLKKGRLCFTSLIRRTATKKRASPKTRIRRTTLLIMPRPRRSLFRWRRSGVRCGR
jgi:hypothetical protein